MYTRPVFASAPVRQSLESLIRKAGRDATWVEADPQQIEQRRRRLLDELGSPERAARRIERILQGNELTDVAYLARGTRCAASVCRVAIRRGGKLLGFGSGSLVAPGVLMTNHHVIDDPGLLAESQAQFDYELDADGNEREPVMFGLLGEVPPILERSLDLALVAVAPTSSAGAPLTRFGWLKLNPQPGKAFLGEYLTIIQHPRGERKQVCVRENRLLKYDENGPFIWYQTDTVEGTSGAPVFNNDWEVVALHHSSVPRTKRIGGKDVWLNRDGNAWDPSQGDDAVDWMANEGVRVSAIARFLRERHPSHPLARLVLEAQEPPRTGESGRLSVENDRDGFTRVRIPVEISFRVSVPGLGASDTAPRVPARHSSGASPQAPISGATAVEQVKIDQSNYAQRNGYMPDFLGVPVPLPRVTGAAAKDVLKAGAGGVLNYWNYSVIFNKRRRLAFVSAANVDTSKGRGNRDADGDAWYKDTRVEKVAAGMQLGNEFYGRQARFEADRARNPFDRGHLSRRSDLQWGDDDQEAKRNGDDSFHFTNCAPQHWAFNQNAKASGIWFRLEVFAASKLTDDPRISLFNGPVFDAPLSKPGADGRLRLDPTGPRHKDGTFGGVAIPKLFFKVIAFRRGDRAVAVAFVVSQEALLASIDRYYPTESAKNAVLTDEEVRLYRVPLDQLRKLTSLNFRGLVDDPRRKLGDEGLRIDSPEDLGL